MDRLAEINEALGRKHKKDKGQILQRICDRAGISRPTLNDKRNGEYPFRDSELIIVLEELKLPLEV